MKTLLALFLLTLTAFALPTSQTGSVRVSWSYDFQANPDVTSFTVYYGANTNVPGWNGSNVVCNCYQQQVSTTNTTIIISNLMRGQTYYFAATATSTNGCESDYSGEARATIPMKPQPIKNLTAQ